MGAVALRSFVGSAQGITSNLAVSVTTAAGDYLVCGMVANSSNMNVTAVTLDSDYAFSEGYIAASTNAVSFYYLRNAPALTTKNAVMLCDAAQHFLGVWALTGANPVQPYLTSSNYWNIQPGGSSTQMLTIQTVPTLATDCLALGAFWTNAGSMTWTSTNANTTKDAEPTGSLESGVFCHATVSSDGVCAMGGNGGGIEDYCFGGIVVAPGGAGGGYAFILGYSRKFAAEWERLKGGLLVPPNNRELATI